MKYLKSFSEDIHIHIDVASIPYQAMRSTSVVSAQQDSLTPNWAEQTGNKLFQWLEHSLWEIFDCRHPEIIKYFSVMYLVNCYVWH